MSWLRSTCGNAFNNLGAVLMVEAGVAGTAGTAGSAREGKVRG